MNNLEKNEISPELTGEINEEFIAKCKDLDAKLFAVRTGVSKETIKKVPEELLASYKKELMEFGRFFLENNINPKNLYEIPDVQGLNDIYGKMDIWSVIRYSRELVEDSLNPIDGSEYVDYEEIE
jgi:hypothetical protein